MGPPEPRVQTTELGTDHTEERRYQMAECKDTDTTAKHHDFEQLEAEKALKQVSRTPLDIAKTG